MKSSEILMDEHRVIEKVLNCLEVMVRQCDAEGKLDGESARAAVDFFREFADRCHHAKEENHLFPLLESRGLPRDGGPTGVMLQEHEMGRAHVRGMSGEIDAASEGDAGALERFIRHASSYIGLLREHIDKEDTCLFPIAEETLTPQDKDTLEQIFIHVDDKEIGQEKLEKYRRIADELAARMSVSSTSGG